MGYFNFYFLKEFYKKHKKRINKLLIFFAIFIIVSILKNKCLAFDYNSDHYIEWYDQTNQCTFRVCTDRDFIISPNQNDPHASNVYDLYTGRLIMISLYRNGVDVYGGEINGSRFNTNNDFYGGQPTITAHKGYYIACTYDTDVHAYYEYSGHCPPFIYNSTDISSWEFTDLQIPLGYGLTPYPHTERWRFTLIVNHNGQNYSYNVSSYTSQTQFYNGSGGNVSSTFNYNFANLNVPKYAILQDVILKKNDVLRFTLKTEYSNDNFNNNIITDYYSLGSFNYGAGANDEINNNMGVINNNLQNIDNSIQQTTQAVEQTTQAVEDNTQAVEDNTQAVEHLEDTITDPTVDDDSLDLPTIDVANPAQQGIENLFINLYNAFCTNTTSDIEIPVPYTNQSFTIPYNLTYDALHNNGGDILIAIITAFWWYKLGGWVVFDIYDKIIKIQEGDAEEVQTSNISKDML